jgi:hypothetical protein
VVHPSASLANEAASLQERCFLHGSNRAAEYVKAVRKRNKKLVWLRQMKSPPPEAMFGSSSTCLVPLWSIWF